MHVPFLFHFLSFSCPFPFSMSPSFPKNDFQNSKVVLRPGFPFFSFSFPLLFPSLSPFLGKRKGKGKKAKPGLKVTFGLRESFFGKETEKEKGRKEKRKRKRRQEANKWVQIDFRIVKIAFWKGGGMAQTSLPDFQVAIFFLRRLH